MTPGIKVDLISDAFSTTHESLMDQMHAQFARQLQARKDQKLLNALGEHLHMDTIPLEFLQGLAKQMTRTVDQQGNERIYLNGEHIITFGPLTFTREGNVMTAHQAYGPVELS